MNARLLVLALSLAFAAGLALPSNANAQDLPLERGNQGSAVERWQSDLNLWFRFVTPQDRGPLVVDGVFGENTEDATEEFQRGQGLPRTGEVDARTRSTLDGVLSRLIATPYTERGLEWPLRIPDWFWPWARWYLGHTEFSGEARNPAVRPAAAPIPIPDWAWRRLGPYVGRDHEARAELLVRQRVGTLLAPVDQLSTTLRSERDPNWILMTGSHEGSEGAFAAWLRMRQDRWVPWHITRLAESDPNLRPTGAPCDLKPAFSEPEC